MRHCILPMTFAHRPWIVNFQLQIHDSKQARWGKERHVWNMESFYWPDLGSFQPSTDQTPSAHQVVGNKKGTSCLLRPRTNQAKMADLRNDNVLHKQFIDWLAWGLSTSNLYIWQCIDASFSNQLLLLSALVLFISYCRTVLMISKPIFQNIPIPSTLAKTGKTAFNSLPNSHWLSPSRLPGSPQRHITSLSRRWRP